MSFGGFGGFGQSNNNQSSGFGGFGSNTNNTTPAFGASSTTSGFGANANTNTSGGGLFGNSGSGGGFGAGGTFGSNNTTSAFGSKPAFGAAATTTGGGLFGSSNTNTGGTSTFGGFGSNNNPNNAATTGGGLFGASKPAFGASSTTTGGSLFGGGAATGGFGASNNPGIGGNVGDPPGTANTPFQAYVERDGASSTQNSFQNILFQDPYKKWSAEELRLADYAQGRRHGNATGAGAFGVSSGFGSGTTFGSNTQQPSAFGSNTGTTGGGLFGSSNNTTATSGFGAQANTGTSAFGSGATGGGLFGQAKPAATGGLFGSGTSQPTQTGGLFGSTAGTGAFGNTATNTTGGFGAGTTANAGGGGLFGSAAQKPGFSFGNTAANTGTGFGATNTNSTFGTNTATGTAQTGGGLFGGAAQNTNAGGGLFGGGATQQNTTGAFGAGGFGAQNQQKPGGLFGAAATTQPTSLFGGGGNTTGGFGQTNAGATGGGLFGAKPAAGATGFGATTAQPAGTGTGLFGSLGANQNQQVGQSSLFPSGGQNQAKPSLFGGATQQSTGGLFGQPQQQGSVFGNQAAVQQQQQQPQGSLFGGSILGGSQGLNSTPQSLTASITDVSAYGTPSLFSAQGTTETANPGPLATPLSSKSKPRRGSVLPMYKLNPASARYVTPQKKGFGFSYSTYGTPGSATSTSSTPGGLGRSLLGASLNRGLNKSVSTSSLRRSFNAEDSILAPGAFSASGGPRFYGNTNSAKKLIINKDMRSDLFATPTKERPLLEAGTGSRKLSKRVSFDTSTAENTEDGDQTRTPTPTSNGALILRETDNDQTPSNGTKLPSNKAPEMEQVSANELAIVHEEPQPDVQTARHAGADLAPGAYWMRPSKEEILSMNRMQRQKVSGFTVGRRNVGQIAFKTPVDLSNIDLDDLFDGIVILETRSATVYPIAAKKPPVGKGLNVPSQISLEQSWPRGRDKRLTTDAKRFAKHVERLKRIEDTTFEGYDKETGVWTFSVEHFTTYGLDYDEDSEGETTALDAHSSAPPTSGRPQQSPEPEDADDTFHFRRNTRLVPGAFDPSHSRFDEDNEAETTDYTGEPSFLGDSSAGSVPQQLMLSVEQPQFGDEYDESENEEMTGTFLRPHPAAERDQYSPDDDDAMQVNETPGGILRARMRAIKDSAAPVKVQVADGNDWMDMLQKTVSPQKRDRAMLKSLRDSVAQHPPDSPTMTTGGRRGIPQAPSDGRGFATSIDLMNSLFEKAKAPHPAERVKEPSRGFLQWPYERQAKVVQPSDEAANISRPRWGPDGTLVLPGLSPTAATHSRSGQGPGDVLVLQKPRLEEEAPGVMMAKFANELSASALLTQVRQTKFGVLDGVPKASLNLANISSIFQERNTSDPGTLHEKLVWELASILFDNLPTDATGPEHQTRKADLGRFWKALVADASSRSTGLAKSDEEKAVACLAGHRVPEACQLLIQGRDYHLATLVALIGTSVSSKKIMKEQLQEWHDANLLSEFSQPIRAIYEMLAGNVGVCEGKKGVPVEDRLDSFTISEEFQLDWKQAFGLRLWYAIAPDDDVSVAVKLFEEDVLQRGEVPPLPWFVEQAIEPLWKDPNPEVRQDLLWGLLRLYSDPSITLDEVLNPENSQLSPLDFRLCWQLGQALCSTKKVSFGGSPAGKSDAVTVRFASQLVNEGSWLEAIYVLLHLEDAKAREMAIRENLCRHANLLGPETGDKVATLTQTFKIPAAWIWEAQALYMRSVEGDAITEVQCLIRADLFSEAHRRLLEQVAPQAIIERDYQGLSDILSKFESKENQVAEWSQGGEVYQDFLSLMRHHIQHTNAPTQLLQKLISSLPWLQKMGNSSIYNEAALAEMSSLVAKIISDSPQKDQAPLLPKVLSLPLTEDSHLSHSVSLSLAYYRGIMAR